MSPRGGQIGEAIRDPLPGLRAQLVNEYRGLFPPEEIDEVAKQALDEFRSARIREYVPVFAWRHARERLRRAS